MAQNIPNADKLKHTWINTIGLSSIRRSGWQFQLPKHCVNVYGKNVLFDEV